MNRPDSQSSPAAEASPARGPLVSRGLRVAAGVIVLATYPLLAMALLWQTDLQRTDTFHVTVSQVVFMTRTFLFHLGLALGAVPALGGCPAGSAAGPGSPCCPWRLPSCRGGPANHPANLRITRGRPSG